MVTRMNLPGPQCQAWIERDRQNLSPSFTRPYPFVMDRGSGLDVWDLDGNHFFYSNVLRRFDPKVPLLRSDTPERWKHRRGYCCPPQLARTIAKMHGYAYSTSDDGLWVHLYGSNEFKT